MKVTIWDLAYFDAARRQVTANPAYFSTIAMKISGWHKQKGDQVNMVSCDDDIYRPYDTYYIIKENKKSANPPKEFFINPKVLRVGAAWAGFKEWDIPDEVLGARPDYVLYPHYLDMKHPYAQIQLFNNRAKPLPTIKNWTNTVEDAVLVVDTTMWYASKNNIIEALKFLQTIKKVSFFEPIWLKKIIYDKDITHEFLKLNLFSVYKLRFSEIGIEDFALTISFIKLMRQYHPKVAKQLEIHIDWSPHSKTHWDSQMAALEDWETLVRIIQMAKEDGIKLVIDKLPSRLDTPYFHLFEELSNWTYKKFNKAWIEYLVETYCRNWDDLYNPACWNEIFRDLLRQTWTNRTLMLFRWGDKWVSENDIPWTILEKEFQYGI